MEKEYSEYITFNVTTKESKEVEMAVIDEFEFEGKHYVVGALIEGDTIKDDACYIYESIIDADGFRVEQIKREFDYRRITEAYLAMDEN